MNKIHIKGYFKNSDINEKIIYNTNGYLMNNTIKFKDNETEIKIKLNNNKITFIKEDDKTRLKNEISIKEDTVCEYILKQEKLSTQIPIKTKRIINKNNIIEVEYYLITDEQHKIKNILHIEYEVLI